jgi:hypothetical protein
MTANTAPDLDFSYGTTYLFPLHGMEAFADDFELGDARVMRLPVHRWAYIEKSSIGDRIFDQAARSPLFAVYTRSDVPASDSAEGFPEVDTRFRCLLMAMRLLRGSVLIDPTLSARYFASGAFTSRHSALYRQSFVNFAPSDPYTLLPDDVGRLMTLRALVQRAGEAAWQEADLVLENLNHRFAPHLTPHNRYGIMCTTLEMLLGPFNKKSLAVRAAAACALSPSWLGERFDERAFLRGPGLELRNIVAHGADRELPLPIEEGVEKLTTVLRRTAAMYLVLRPRHTGDATPVDWFNTILADIASVDAAASSLAREALRDAAMDETPA